MKDIGFDLIDRRTVIIVLVTFVLAYIFLGYQIPVDIQNAQNLFVGLVMLTGYIYFARTIYRLPVALVISTMSIINFYFDKRENTEKKEKDESLPSSKNSFFKRLGLSILSSISWVIYAIFSLPFLLILLLYLVLTFGDYSERENEIISGLPKKARSYFRKNRSSAKMVKAFFDILDRIGVVCIAVIATIPQLGNLVKIIGVSGLVAMVALFIFRGNFTALIKDIVEKEEEDKKREAKNKAENSRSNPLFVEVVNSDEKPIEIKNTKYNPLIIDTDYYNPIPVQVVKGIENSSSNPLTVQILHGVKIFSEESIPVEVTNIVTTQQDE
jgi:hypothetical protein